MSSVYLTGTVAGTYHGLSTVPEADQPAHVVVTVQMRQVRPGAPFITGVLWCGHGEAGERRAAEVRRELVRDAQVSLAGEAITYCARANSLNVRGLEAVNVVTPMRDVVRFESLRPTTPESTTSP
jgi:hypothetical protein